MSQYIIAWFSTRQKLCQQFVQSFVGARRAGDENPESSVVAESMKLFGNRSYNYQIMDRSRHTETKYLKVEKTHKAMNGKFLKDLTICRKNYTFCNCAIKN